MVFIESPLHNRRKFPRRPLVKPIGLLHRGDYYIVRGEEIGEGGISFKCNSIFPVGDSVLINIPIVTGVILMIHARIRNHNSMGRPGTPKVIEEDVSHGCFFSDLKFDDRRFIRSYVSSRNIDL